MINMGDIAGMIISILRDRRRQHEKHCAQQFVSCLVPTPRELDQNMWICFNERKRDISLSMYIIICIYMTLMTLGMVSFLGSSLHGAQALDTRTGRGVTVIHRLALLH